MRESIDLNPVEATARRRAWLLLLIPIILLFLAGTYLFWRFAPDAPVDYVRIADHFKYGSIGSEPVNGIPYWIWKVLPDMFPEYLPDGRAGNGYKSVGVLYEEGKDLPIGFSNRRVFIDRVGVNCALCHTGTVRDTPDSPRRVYLGMPSNNLDLQSYFLFIFKCAADGRFTPDNVLAEIEARTELNFVERIIYRQAVFLMREQAIQQRERVASFVEGEHKWGPGRVDTFNPYKAVQFNWPMRDEKSIGTADYPSIWNQKPREGMQLHWDGNNTSVEERNKSAALGAGVAPPTLDLNRVKRVEDWVWTLQPYPYPYPVDEARAAKGEELFKRHCYDCHSFGGSEVGKVVPIWEIKTDPERLDSFTYLLATNQNTLYAGYDYRFSHFRKTNGYANMPLDGIWLRAPYLHNGSVPTLRDLLELPEKRPSGFYKGYDVYDPVKVGFRGDVAEDSTRRYFWFDTTKRGNGSGGHIYGTNLTPEEKDALVEYMKKL